MSSDLTSQFVGPAACLAAALLWAVAVGLFRRPIEKYGARSVNLAKCLLAAALQGATVWVLGQSGALAAAPASSLAMVAFSGLVGLVLGDTALFGAVARIGVHRTLLLQTLAPVFTAIVAFTWLGETLTPLQLAGAALIMAGIVVVVAPRRRGEAPQPGGEAVREGAGLATAGLAAGLALGVLAAFGQGAGIVMAKDGMRDMPVLASSFVRLGSAALGLLLLETATGRIRMLGRIARDGRTLARAVPATLLGTYLALFLMMAGIALAPASIAAVLLSTSPVFSLFIESAVEKRPISGRGLLGTLLAVAGVAMLTAF